MFPKARSQVAAYLMAVAVAKALPPVKTQKAVQCCWQRKCKACLYLQCFAGSRERLAGPNMAATPSIAATAMRWP